MLSNENFQSPVRCLGGELFTLLHRLETGGYQVEGFKAGGPLGNAAYEVKFFKKSALQSEMMLLPCSNDEAKSMACLLYTSDAADE